MDVNRIREQANLHINIPIAHVSARRWINEAMHVLSDLYDTANVKDNFDIVVDDLAAKYSLPSGCKRVKRVYLNNRSYEDYYIDIDEICFRDKGNFKIELLMIPADVNLNTDVPAINEGFHMAISYFVAYKEVCETKPNRAQELLASFYQYAKEANSRLSRIKRKKRIPVGNWR